VAAEREDAPASRAEASIILNFPRRIYHTKPISDEDLSQVRDSAIAITALATYGLGGQVEERVALSACGKLGERVVQIVDGEDVDVTFMAERAMA
jgi:hypothetical protein